MQGKSLKSATEDFRRCNPAAELSLSQQSTLRILLILFAQVSRKHFCMSPSINFYAASLSMLFSDGITKAIRMQSANV